MKLGTPPSELGSLKRFMLKLTSRPKWMGSEETDLNWFIDAAADLKRNGIVVPGTFIQANSMLFSAGNDDHPGELLFPLTDADPLNLLSTASEIFDLKGEEFDTPEDAFFSRYLADERERVQGIPVSSRISPDDKLYVSTTIFYRRHLPDHRLAGKVYPLLVSPKSLVAMILPCHLWSTQGWSLYGRFSRRR